MAGQGKGTCHVSIGIPVWISRTDLKSQEGVAAICHLTMGEVNTRISRKLAGQAGPNSKLGSSTDLPCYIRKKTIKEDL